MLDYDYQMVQFLSMSSAIDHVSAIDQYGEVWFLCGENKEWLNMGFDCEDKNKIKPKFI